jgi:hypothetical protein
MLTIRTLTGDRATLVGRLTLRRMINRIGTLNIRTAHTERPKKQTKLSTKSLIAALLLIGTASTASAQYLPYNGCSSLRERGYYGTPSGGGPQYDYGGGDQYGYGPGYSYARQAPDCTSRTSRLGTRHGRTTHEK